VLALNVIRLRQDIVAPHKHMQRLAGWKERVESGSHCARLGFPGISMVIFPVFKILC
jgi:hypothetical protein